MCVHLEIYIYIYIHIIYLFKCLFMLHAVADEWNDLTVIFKVYQDRLRQEEGLIADICTVELEQVEESICC